MSSEISTALTLLAIGMITVFAVLLLVVVTGNILIRLSNNLVSSSDENDTISGAKIAAITTAVELYTHGKGSITKIERE